jgi:hypothetical protein
MKTLPARIKPLQDAVTQAAGRKGGRPEGYPRQNAVAEGLSAFDRGGLAPTVGVPPAPPGRASRSR